VTTDPEFDQEIPSFVEPSSIAADFYSPLDPIEILYTFGAAGEKGFMALAAPFQDSDQCLDSSPILFQQDRDSTCKRYVTECNVDESAYFFSFGYDILAQPHTDNATSFKFESTPGANTTLNTLGTGCDNYVTGTVVNIVYDEVTGLLTNANVTFTYTNDVPLNAVVEVTTKVVFSNGKEAWAKSGSPGYQTFLPLLTSPGIALVFQ
jgi:hypothetical protein